MDTPKSSRHKSHRSDKHSSGDAMKRSDSEDGGSLRDRMKRSDEASVGSGARVLRNTEGKKRKSSLPDVYLEKDKDGSENGDSLSGKKRKERGEDLAKPDTWNGSSNDDRLTEKGSKKEGYGPVDPEKVKNSKALSVESKSRYSRHESSTERHGDNVSRTESVKRRSEREHALRDYRDHKERDKERCSDREKVRERELVRDKKVQDSRHGRSDEVKSRSQHSRRGGAEVETKAKKESQVRKEELKKAPEKLTKRSSSCGSDKGLDDSRNCDDKRLSSRNDSIKNGSYKVERHKDERCKDDKNLGKHYKDLDRDPMDHRHHDTRHREGRSSRIYISDQLERKSSTDRDNPFESYKKSKLNGGDSELIPSADDHVIKLRENRVQKMSYDENDEHYGLKKERTNVSRSDKDKDASHSSKFDYRHQGKVVSSLTSTLSRNSSSPKIPSSKEQSRCGLEQAECIHREPVCNDRAGSTEDNDRFSVVHERDFVLLSSEKTQHKVGMNSDDGERRTLAESQSTDNQFQADFQTEPASVTLEPFKRANHFPGKSPGQLIPQPSMIHVMNNPSIREDDMRIKPGDCRSNSHYRNCDPNIERGPRMDLRNGPTWPAPCLNGFIPFQQRPPAPKFHPSVQHFPPYLFGARPHMEMNQTMIHYHVLEVADRFPGEHHYSGWHHPVDDLVLPQMNGWDGNSSPFGCKPQPYGRSDWNQNRHPMGSHGETWKGQNPNTVEIPSPREVADESRNIYPSLESNSEVDHFGHASHTAAQTKQLSVPPYSKSKEASAESKLNSFSQLPKIFRDDSKYFCSYLSKIEISTDLIHPELYKEITNLLTSVNSTAIYHVSKDQGAKNNRAPNSAKFSNQRKSLPQIATAAAAFKRAISVYEKQTYGRQVKTLDVAVTANTTSTLDFEGQCTFKSAASSPVGGEEDRTDDANITSPIDMEEVQLVEYRHGDDDCKKLSDGLISDVSMESSLRVCEDTITPLCKVNLIRIHARPDQSAH